MAEEGEAGADVLPDDATEVDDAASMVSGLSAYAASTAATSTAASTGRPASTVGGRRPQRNKQKVSFGLCFDILARTCDQVCAVTPAFLRYLHNIFMLINEMHLMGSHAFPFAQITAPCRAGIHSSTLPICLLN